ncbi:MULTISPECIES: MtrAB system histidine kinase MtrB [unclassified Plantibacter]|uniref:MtrAB system histidine kinase MtrB n=1 Tax=unclassified Plantibacter TaxID=2624265 RepID=UPI003D32B476
MASRLAGWAPDWSDWRSWPGRIAGQWRRSLQFRTVAITVGLSGLAILLTGAYLSFSIGNDLFQSRLQQALSDSGRAMTSAQGILDASDATERVALQQLMSAVRSDLQATSASRLIAAYRAPGQDYSAVAPPGFEAPGLAGGVVSESLRDAVQKKPDDQWWQSVTLTASDGSTSAGIVVGSEVTMPSAGSYQVYLGYDLRDSEQTLGFVQRTLFLAGVGLMLLVGGAAWLVVRFLATPIRSAAETSQRLADGNLDVRMPEKGEDELATLARSFNGMADSMQTQIKELAELSLVQQRFVSDVSHELRTPLTTIRLAGDVLYDQRDTFPPATERTAELLHDQVGRFEILLADLLEISRYDAGSIELDLEQISLVHLAEEVIAELQPLADPTGSDIRLVAPGGYSTVPMDPRRIRRIVRNLIGNAIEHGEGRPIVVSVDSNESAVALAVRDYGLGMSAEATERVFDRFWRADPSRKRTIGGTGLGLAISLEDASLHRGRLEVWSELGAGSSFRLTLPREVGGGIVRSPLSLPPEDALESVVDELRIPESGSITTIGIEFDEHDSFLDRMDRPARTRPKTRGDADA